MHALLPAVILFAVASGPIIAAEPDAKALQHGALQVERMLRDRPEMTRYPTVGGFMHLSQDDPQVKWAIRKFAGEDTGFLIYWDPKPPMDVNEAQHTSRDASGRAIIRVAKVGFPLNVTKENAFEVMWMGTVFELLNITRHERFEKLGLRALQKQISRNEYVRGMAKVEYEALRQLQSYAKEQWTPWASQAGANMDLARWWVFLPETFDVWMERYRDTNGYPWHPYGIYYDELLGTAR